VRPGSSTFCFERRPASERRGASRNTVPGPACRVLARVFGRQVSSVGRNWSAAPRNRARCLLPGSSSNHRSLLTAAPRARVAVLGIEALDLAGNWSTKTEVEPRAVPPNTMATFEFGSMERSWGMVRRASYWVCCSRPWLSAWRSWWLARKRWAAKLHSCCFICSLADSGGSHHRAKRSQQSSTCWLGRGKSTATSASAAT